MLDQLKKIIKEKEKITKKINKSYKWIIISIITLAFGFILPGYLIPKFAVLEDLFNLIDGLFMLVTGENAVITPLIYIGLAVGGALGTVLNTVKLVLRKIKLININGEEKQEIKRIEKTIKELANENKLTKEELEETKEATKEILMDIKDDVLNTIANSEEETLVNNQIVDLNEPNLEHEKIKERKNI